MRNQGKLFYDSPKQHMKNLLGNHNTKVGKENVFKPTIWNESQLQDNNYNGVRTVKFVRSKDLVVKINIHKYTWNSPDNNNEKQINHMLIVRWYSIIPDVRSFRGADCDTVRSLVIAKVRERLTGNKPKRQKMNVEGFDFRKLNELEVRKQYQIKI